jgi:hypothetical protein
MSGFSGMAKKEEAVWLIQVTKSLSNDEANSRRASGQAMTYDGGNQVMVGVNASPEMGVSCQQQVARRLNGTVE